MIPPEPTPVLSVELVAMDDFIKTLDGGVAFLDNYYSGAGARESLAMTVADFESMLFNGRLVTESYMRRWVEVASSRAAEMAAAKVAEEMIEMTANSTFAALRAQGSKF